MKVILDVELNCTKQDINTRPLIEAIKHRLKFLNLCFRDGTEIVEAQITKCDFTFPEISDILKSGRSVDEKIKELANRNVDLRSALEDNMAVMRDLIKDD